MVGIVLGARMDSTRIDGMRGWGVPAETVLEVSWSIPLEGDEEDANLCYRCSACRD